jgi:MYXO-CTERM domain-containing protein
MIFWRISTLALALAAGLAAPAFAATWKIEFFGFPDPSSVGTGSFTADLPVGVNSSPATGWTATVSGFTFSNPGRAFLKNFPSPIVSGGIIHEFTAESGEISLVGSINTWNLVLPTQILRGTYKVTRVEPEDPSVIPLPATAALLPLGLVALGALRRRRTG